MGFKTITGSFRIQILLIGNTESLIKVLQEIFPCLNYHKRSKKNKERKQKETQQKGMRDKKCHKKYKNYNKNRKSKQ